MSVLNLISQSDRKLFEESDFEELKKHGFLCKCDTCGQNFFETHLGVIKDEIKKKKWNKPQPWFLFGCLHWLEAHPNMLHQIRVYRIFPSGTKELRFDITDHMLAQLKDPKSPFYNQSQETLLKDLNYELKKLGLHKESQGS